MTWRAATPAGEIPVDADRLSGGPVVILAHGAGSHMAHKRMLWLSDLTRQAGASVVRFNFAYREQGKSMPDRMPLLMATYRAVIESVRAKEPVDALIIGGHSMGGRVASMIAAEGDSVDGLLLFGYPLHPPRQFDKLRDAHLPSIAAPVLQISGTRDDFCRRDLMEAVTVGDQYRVVWIDGADHSYSVSRASGNTKANSEQTIVEAIGGWLAATIAPRTA